MDNQGNEILTLAFGHYSCHVAANYFNIQEASFSYNPNYSTGINHDVLFREGSSQSRYAYSPRLITIDDSDSLGFLSEDGYFKQSDTVVANSSGPEVILKETPWQKNEFLFDLLNEKKRVQCEKGLCKDYLLQSTYNLDDNVVSWSDYLITEFSNKTIVTVPKNTNYYGNADKFSTFDQGNLLWSKTRLCDDIEENVRFFMEEIGNLQGFQILMDGDNGYAGIASGCIDLLKDDYSKKDILAVPCIYSNTLIDQDVRTWHKKNCEKVYTLAANLASCSQSCDVVTPMSHVLNPWSKNQAARKFRNLNYKHDLMYHTSAILASALDLFTLPCRLQNSSTSLRDITSHINIYGRSVASVGLKIPLPIAKDVNFLSEMEKMTGGFFDSLTPLIESIPEQIDIQSVTTKGLGKNENASQISGGSLEVLEESFKMYLHKLFPGVVTKFTACKSTFRVPRTYPKILNDHFNLTNVDNIYGPLSQFMAVGGIHNNREMGPVLNALYEETKAVKSKAKGIPGFGPRDSDFDYSESFENLKILSNTYFNNMYI